MPDLPQYYQHSRAEMLPFVPATVKHVLDVGCGAGGFGRTLKEHFNPVVWGIEMNAEAAGRASTVLDKVICSEFNESCFPPDQKFDCIAFNDVLEHMLAPERALQLAKGMLAPEGVIIASIPNVRHFSVVWDLVVNGNWNYRDAGILDRTHFRFFTRSSIIRMFEDAGMLVTRCDGINARGIGRKFQYLNALSFNAMSDMKFEQFAVVGKSK